MTDYSMHTASWHRRVDEIQDALRQGRYATALAKLADLQASIIEVDMIAQDMIPPTASEVNGAAAS